jgi:hypothetical protein
MIDRVRQCNERAFGAMPSEAKVNPPIHEARAGQIGAVAERLSLLENALSLLDEETNRTASQL